MSASVTGRPRTHRGRLAFPRRNGGVSDDAPAAVIVDKEDLLSGFSIAEDGVSGADIDALMTEQAEMVEPALVPVEEQKEGAFVEEITDEPDMVLPTVSSYQLPQAMEKDFPPLPSVAVDSCLDPTGLPVAKESASALTFQVPESAFHPVAQVPWEREIVWADAPLHVAASPLAPSAPVPAHVTSYTAALGLVVEPSSRYTPHPASEEAAAAAAASAPAPAEPDRIKGIVRQGVRAVFHTSAQSSSAGKQTQTKKKQAKAKSKPAPAAAPSPASAPASASPWSPRVPLIHLSFAPPDRLPSWARRPAAPPPPPRATESALSHSGIAASSLKPDASPAPAEAPFAAIDPARLSAVARAAMLASQPHCDNVAFSTAGQAFPYHTLDLTPAAALPRFLGRPVVQPLGLDEPWEETVARAAADTPPVTAAQLLPAAALHLFIDATAACVSVRDLFAGIPRAQALALLPRLRDTRLPTFSQALQATAPPRPGPAAAGLNLSLDEGYLHRLPPAAPHILHALPAVLLQTPWFRGISSVTDGLRWHRPLLPMAQFRGSNLPRGLLGAGASRKVPLLEPGPFLPPASPSDFSRSSCLAKLAQQNPRHEVVPAPDVSPEALVADLLQLVSDARPAPMLITDTAALSASTGALVLLEHTDQYPLLLQNAGMAQEVVTYYRRRRQDQARTDAQLATMVAPGALGRIRILTTHEPTPQLLLYDVAPGSSATFLENKLYVAPISRTPQPRVYRDFLLVNTQTAGGPEAARWTLRRMPRVHTVGKVTPKVPIPSPRSREYLDLRQKWAKAAVLYFFSKLSSIMPAAYFNYYFGDGTEEYTYDAALREAFRTETVRHAALEAIAGVAKWRKPDAATALGGRDIGNYNGTGTFEVHDKFASFNDEQLADMCSPEDACVAQTVAAGLARLRNKGIFRYYALDEPGIGHTLYRGDSIDKARNEAVRTRGAREQTLLAVNPIKSLRQKVAKMSIHSLTGIIRIGAWILRHLRRTPWALSGALEQSLRYGRHTVQEGGAFLKLPERLPVVGAIDAKDRNKASAARAGSTGYSVQQLRDRDAAAKVGALGPTETPQSVLLAAGYSDKELSCLTQQERMRRSRVVRAVSQLLRASTPASTVAAGHGLVGAHKKAHRGGGSDPSEAHIGAISDFDPPPPPRSATHTAEVPRETGARAADGDRRPNTVFSVAGGGPKGLSGFIDESTRLSGHDMRPLTLYRGQNNTVRGFSVEQVKADKQMRPYFSPYGGAEAYNPHAQSGPHHTPVTDYVIKRTVTRTKPDGTRTRLVEYILDPDAILRFERDPSAFPPSYEHGMSTVSAGDGRGVVATTREEIAIPQTGRGRKPKKAVTQNVAATASSGRKRKADDDDDEEFVLPGASRSGGGASATQSRRRKPDAVTALSDVLRGCLGHLNELPLEIKQWFMLPVKKKDSHNYHLVITSPMDLSTMRDKLNKNKYKSCAMFEADLMLIRRNSETFNGPASPITQAAEQLLEHARAYLRSQQTEELLALEQEVAQQQLQASLNELTRLFVDETKKLDCAKHFVFAPTDKVVPGYSSVIKRPIALHDMREKCLHNRYASANEFLNDVELMKSNCDTYNRGPDSTIRDYAAEILRRAVEFVDSLPMDVRAYQGVPQPEEERKPKRSGKQSQLKKQRTQAAEATAASIARTAASNKKIAMMSNSNADDDDDDDFFD